MQLIERSDCHTLFCCAVNLTLGYSCEDQVNKLLQKIDKTVFYKIDCRMAVDRAWFQNWPNKFYFYPIKKQGKVYIL